MAGRLTRDSRIFIFPCNCSAEGLLEVEVNTPLAALQVRSVIQQLTASRSELIDWLEDCWRA
ncbi:Asr1405/Asl0597 family protein [Kovacikia minuta]|uniref:Asr1405/Asl0597 family protein n=1 Tax=Kovacikia minuta TaxID=2931930 RepID=UPI0036F1AF44